MADINLLPEEFRAQEQKERERVKKQAKDIAIPLTNPERSRQDERKGWHKLFGGLKESVFKSLGKNSEKTLPAIAKKGNLNISKTDISGLFQKIDQPHRSVGLPAKNSLSQNNRSRETDFSVKENSQLPPENIFVAKPPITTPPPLANLSASVSHSVQLKNTKVQTNNKLEKNLANVQIFNSSSGGLLIKLRAAIHKVFHFNHKKEAAISVDLMPERLLTIKEIDWSRVARMLLASVGVGVALVFVGYLTLFNKNQKQENDFRNLEQKLADSNLKIVSLLDEQQSALMLQKKLQLADTLISGHIYWSKFLDFLELNTLDGLYFEGLAFTLETDEISLSGRAEDLATIFWQRDKLVNQSEMIKSVLLSSFSIDPLTEVASFELLLRIDQTRLKK